MTNTTRFPWEHDGDIVAFETPEQTRVEHRIAPFGSRVAAAALDNIILSLLSVFLVVGGIVVWVAARSVIRKDEVLYVVAVLIAVHFLLTTFYFVWSELRGEGRTYGKRRLRIRTVMATGQGLTFGASLVRNIARLVDNMPLLWLVPALTKGKRRLGDLIAGTLVIVDEGARQEREPDARRDDRPSSYRELTDRRFYFSAEVAAKLFPDDLNLLEHLEERLGAADPQQRKRVIEDVARKYVERLGLQAEEAQVLEQPGRFLMELSLFLRERFEGQAY